MKKSFLNNFPLKILSVICAIILWLVVMNISDYTMTVEIDDIPVTRLNGDVLDDLEQVYDVEKGDTVDIIVKGRRSIVSQLDENDFTATADLSSMSITNTVQINVEANDRSVNDDISITCVDNVMKLVLEDKVSVQFAVYVNTDGEPTDGYAVCETVASPNIITVEGPKSAVDKITTVSAVVSVANKNSEYNTTGTIELYDAYGELISNDKVTVSHDSVDIAVKIYPEKTVPVVVNVKGKPEDGYAVGEVQYQPQTMVIAGPDEDLADIEQIEIDDISVSGMSEDLQSTVNINKYLADNVNAVDSTGDVLINIAIEKMEEKSLALTESNFSLTNKQAGYSYTLTLSENCAVIVSGLSHIIDDITMDDIKPVIDCTDMKVGENTAVISFKDIDGVEYTISGSVTVNIERSN